MRRRVPGVAVISLLAVACGSAGTAPPTTAEQVFVERAVAPVISTTTTSTTTTTVAPTTTTTSTTTTTVAPATTVAPTTTTTKPPPPPAPAPPPPPSSTTTTTTAPATGQFSSSAEAGFFQRINSLRVSEGLPQLTRSGSLDSYARSWTQRMAQAGELSHSNIKSLLGPWSTVGENVGYGPSVDLVFSNLAASPGHRANMLGTSYTHVGIGAYIDAQGRLWTTHVFGG